MIEPICIELGRGYFYQDAGIGKFTDVSEPLVSLGYGILKEPLKSGDKVKEDNKSCEVVRLYMTTSYARNLAADLLKLADSSDEKFKKEEQESYPSDSVKSVSVEENGMKAEAMYYSCDDIDEKKLE